MNLSRISIISVAYHSADVLPDMLKTIPEGPEVIIVDNGEDDGFRSNAAEFGVKLIVPGKNLGFGAACNLGAEAAKGDLLLFLNPDTKCYPDTLQQFLKGVEKHPDASAFGASLEDEKGWVRYAYVNKLTPYAKPDPWANPEQDTEVQMLCGAAMLVRRSAFDRIGGFDPEIFLYLEDDEISLRLRQQVGPVVYLPNARVMHIAGASTPYSDETNRFKGYHWQRSHIYGLRKHGVGLARTRVILHGLADLLKRETFYVREWRHMVLGRLLGSLGILRHK